MVTSIPLGEGEEVLGTRGGEQGVVSISFITLRSNYTVPVIHILTRWLAHLAQTHGIQRASLRDYSSG